MTKTDDPIGLALASIGLGATVGATVVTAGILILRSLQAIGGTGAQPGVEFTVLGTTFFGGVAAGLLTAFLTSRGIEDLWRRAVITAIATFGTVLLSAITAPIDIVGGRTGLGVYLITLIVGAAYLRSRARAAAA